MTLASHKRPAILRRNEVGSDAWRVAPPPQDRSLRAVGLSVIASLVLVGLSLVAGAFIIHTLGAQLFRQGQAELQRGSDTMPSRGLKLQSQLVERPRAALAAYAANLTAFKAAAAARPPSSGGINLGAAEIRRREAVMTSLVLECIDAVDTYNLIAQTISAAQLQSAGLPVSFSWGVDCALQ